jgi:molybdate transport system substrate-binding protein
MIFPMMFSNPPATLSLVLLLNLSVFLSSASAQDLRPTLTIAAASDLSGLAKEFERGFPEANLIFSFGASGALARQIEAGAPFDLFLCANDAMMEPLVKKGKIDKDAQQVYAIGRIALWSKTGAVRTFADLRRPEVKLIALANPQTAPYGMAGKQALERAGLLPELESKLVYAESIRQTMQFAETGNADAAVLSWSFVFDKGGILIDDRLHAPLRQVAAPVRRKGGNAKLAERFIQFLLSPAGRSIFAQNGFNLLPGAPTLRRQ